MHRYSDLSPFNLVLVFSLKLVLSLLSISLGLSIRFLTYILLHKKFPFITSTLHLSLNKGVNFFGLWEIAKLFPCKSIKDLPVNIFLSHFSLFFYSWMSSFKNLVTNMVKTDSKTVNLQWQIFTKCLKVTVTCNCSP